MIASNIIADFGIAQYDNIGQGLFTLLRALPIFQIGGSRQTGKYLGIAVGITGAAYVAGSRSKLYQTHPLTPSTPFLCD